MPTRFAAGLIIAVATMSFSRASTLTAGASHDTTLINYMGNANGSGQYLFAGFTQSAGARRGLLAFDLTGIPADATVTGVTLTLHMSKTVTGTYDLSLHKVAASWGEGASDASGDEGAGAAPAIGDATWTRRFYDTVSWTTPGGDYVAAPSAVTPVGNIAFYNWTGPGLVADVQSWIANPAENFGWLLRGPEGGGISAKRFDTRESPTVANRPVLVVQFVPEPAGIAGWGILLGLAFSRRRRLTRQSRASATTAT